MPRVFLGLALVAAMVGCNTGERDTTDGPPPGEGVGLDTRTDAARDASRSDAPRSRCNEALDLSPLALAPGYCVRCRVALTGDVMAFAYGGTRVWTYTIAVASDGGGYLGEVRERALEVPSGTLGGSQGFFSFVRSGGKLFANEYLALSPAGQVAVGYAASGSYDGEVLYGEKGATSPSVVAQATGNYDALFLDEQTLLINGMGAGDAQDGQGVYLAQQGQAPRRLITKMGGFSGHLALAPDVLYAGGYFVGGNKVYGFSLAEVQAAIASGGTLAADADGDLVHAGEVGDVVALPDRGLVLARLDGSLAFEAVTVIPVTVNGNAVAPGVGRDLITPGGGGRAPKRLFAWGAELALLLEDTSQSLELAVIEAR